MSSRWGPPTLKTSLPVAPAMTLEEAGKNNRMIVQMFPLSNPTTTSKRSDDHPGFSPVNPSDFIPDWYRSGLADSWVSDSAALDRSKVKARELLITRVPLCIFAALSLRSCLKPSCVWRKVLHLHQAADSLFTPSIRHVLIERHHPPAIELSLEQLFGVSRINGDIKSRTLSWIASYRTTRFKRC